MKFVSKALIVVAVTTCSACATSRYCIGEQDYQTAVSIPPLTGAGELSMPASQSALVIPDAPEKKVPYGEIITTEKGKEAARCLDRPPVIPPLAEAKDSEA